MKPLFRLAVRLYPAWWRRRYGRELAALLEDTDPGWPEWLNVTTGALAMRMTTLGVIPVACALAGAIAAALLTMRTPEVYAASATILLADRDAANAPAPGEELRVSLARALEASHGSPAETSVTLLRERAGQATIRLTYLDRDPARAQRMAQSLADAIVAKDAARTPSPRIVEAPHLPTAPVAPAYAAAGASGGAVGLAAGALCALILRLRRRQTSVQWPTARG